MSVRTTSDLVGGIIEVDSAIDLTPFILTASVLVDKVEDADELEDSELELVERWLAAHFYTVRDPRAVSEKAGPVGATYQSKVDLNLASSHYGQTALLMDTTGTLRRISAGKRTVSVAWMGTELDSE